jgi:alpha-ketoglutarate-dependent taurine dioxygenase
MATTSAIDIQPVTARIGATVSGVDLTRSLDAKSVRQIRQAVLDHGVVFLRGQMIAREQMLGFIENFGTLCPDPMAAEQDVPAAETIMDIATLVYRQATAVWHTDSTLAETPASLIALRPIALPAVGGDTCWCDMYSAYDALSEPLRAMLDRLTAAHSAAKVMPLMQGAGYSPLQEAMRAVHPVVRVHPETGRKALFVNELWTETIVELSPAEGKAVLALLYEHVKSPEFSMRWRWRLGDIALWDNRSCQHYALRDYDATRVMEKSILMGDRPYGPN